MPERSRTSRVPTMYSYFAQKSFCYDGLRHTQIHNKQIGPIVLPPLLKWEDEGHYFSASMTLYDIMMSLR